jgi:methyl-accepting chemotaxis protein
LAAQAEQLQETIAYFRTENAGRENQHRNPSGNERSVFRDASKRKKAPASGSRTTKAAPARQTKGKANGRDDGFSLDMASGGSDARDSDFERF